MSRKRYPRFMVVEKQVEKDPGDGPLHLAWRPFRSVRSEEWDFYSPLTPDELSARLELSWDTPFRVYGYGAWGYYWISAVLQPHGKVFVRLREDYNQDFPLTRRAFRKKYGQRFTGRIEPAASGSRLSGRVGLQIPSWLTVLLITASALYCATFAGAGILLLVALAVMVAVIREFVRVRRRRAAIWKFLHTAAQTPAGEKLVDDIDRDIMIRRAEGR